MTTPCIPEPIIYGEYLHVIPSAHYDLVFAETVAGALAKRKYDTIAVEMPANLPVIECAEQVARLDRAPGVAISIDGRLLGREKLPADVGGDDIERETRHVMAASMIPLMPGDSICEAIRIFAELRRAGDPVELEFVDLPISSCGQRRGAARITDTWVAMRNRGLERFLEIIGDGVQAGRLPEDDTRELYMVSRIMTSLRRKRRCLLVIGAAHWSGLKALLDATWDVDHAVKCQPIEPSARFRIYGIDAASAWAAGWLGIPWVVASWVRHRSRNTPEAFDLPQAIDQLIQRALAVARKKRIDVAPRTWLLFRKYLLARMSLDGRITARLDGDLCRAARAAGLGRFETVLKEEALRYPRTAGKDFPKTRFIVHNGAGYLLAGKIAVAVEGSGAESGSGEERTLPARPPRLTKRQRKQAESQRLWRRMPIEEDHLQRVLANRVWHAAQMAREKRPREAVRPFTGDYGRGIHIRKTIFARARGQSNALYVKQATRRSVLDLHRNSCASPDVPESLHAPILWVFDPHAAHVSYQSAQMDDTVSSAYALSQTGVYPGGAGVTHEKVSLGINYLRGRVKYDAELIRPFLKALPDSQKPRILPWNDVELKKTFTTTTDLFAASAVKYAGKRAIVVSDHRWQPSQALLAYAKERGVELVTLSWDAVCSPEVKHRYSLQHTVPGTRYGAIDWAEKFVPPIPPEFSPRRS